CAALRDDANRDTPRARAASTQNANPSRMDGRTIPGPDPTKRGDRAAIDRSGGHFAAGLANSSAIYLRAGLGFFRTGFSPEAGAGMATAGLTVPPAGGVATEVPPSEYAFFRNPSATCCALPVSSLVCFALLYSLTARSRCPSM